MQSRGIMFQWEGKKLYRQRIPTPRVLEPLPAPLSVGEQSGNMVIEGDNLQVLASLKSQYAGLIDVAYLDPPYNLGTNDFRYSDKRFHDPDADDDDAVYVSNQDGGRHTKWLNFVAPRLYFIRQMLSNERGVVFVSINDVELFRLGMLMNEIFGESNHVGTICWHGSTDNNPTRIAAEHEYILCYAKNKQQLESVWNSVDNEVKTFMLDSYQRIKEEHKKLPAIKKQFKAFVKEQKEYLGDIARYKEVDKRGPYAARRNLDNPGKPGPRYDVIHPITNKPCRVPVWGWRYTEVEMKRLIAEDRILFGKDETRIPQLKVHLEDVTFPLRSVIRLDARAGSNTLEELFGARDKFKNPKPVELIERLLSYTTTKTSVVLDAFAGSGTTGHATLSLNKRDGGKRRFIMIEEGKNGDKFCRTLTAERIKRAIKAYEYDDGFTFYTTGKKIDRAAIVGLERESLVSLICQADETGRGRGITRLNGYKYIIGKNGKNEAICLVWKGEDNSEVTKDDLMKASEEVTKADLKRPFRIYGTVCRVGDTSSWKFCQIPDAILAQLHINADAEEPE